MAAEQPRATPPAQGGPSSAATAEPRPPAAHHADDGRAVGLAARLAGGVIDDEGLDKEAGVVAHHHHAVEQACRAGRRREGGERGQGWGRGAMAGRVPAATARQHWLLLRAVPERHGATASSWQVPVHAPAPRSMRSAVMSQRRATSRAVVRGHVMNQAASIVRRTTRMSKPNRTAAAGGAIRQASQGGDGSAGPALCWAPASRALTGALHQRAVPGTLLCSPAMVMKRHVSWTAIVGGSNLLSRSRMVCAVQLKYSTARRGARAVT